MTTNPANIIPRHLDGPLEGVYDRTFDSMTCGWCRDTGKVYPEDLRRGGIVLDTVPGYDPRVPCPHCEERDRRVAERAGLSLERARELGL